MFLAGKVEAISYVNYIKQIDKWLQSFFNDYQPSFTYYLALIGELNKYQSVNDRCRRAHEHGQSNLLGHQPMRMDQFRMIGADSRDICASQSFFINRVILSYHNP
jgi:DNA polymerase sigma